MEATLNDLLPLRYSVFWTAVWCCALITASLCRATRRWGTLQSVGLGLMTVPLWTALWGFVNSIPALLDPGSVLQPASRARLSRMYYRSLLVDLGYLGAGFLLWSAGRPTGLRAWLGRLWHTDVRSLARRLREAGLPMGGRSEARSVIVGYLFFPVLLLGTWAAQVVAVASLPQLFNGDESRYWIHMTPYHAVMISLAAGVTEELVYRGLLMALLFKGARRWMPARGAAATAVVLQAVLFGAAHGGYGTWFHVLMPLLFGLVAGAVAWRWGLWAAIVLHVQVDLYVFGALLSDAQYPWSTPLLVGLLALNLAVLLAWSGRRLVLRLRAPEAGAG